MAILSPRQRPEAPPPSGRQGSPRLAHRTGVEPLTVAGSPQLAEASCVLVAGWLVDDGAKEQADGFVLAGSAQSAVPVRGENGFADVVASVVGQVVSVLRLGEVRQVRDDVLGLAHEDRGFGQVVRDCASRPLATRASMARC